PLPPPSRPAAPRRTPPPAQAGVPTRQYSVMPRSGSRFDVRIDPGADGKQVITITGGVILNVNNAPGLGLLDLEADRLVIWTRGADPQGLLNKLQTSQGESANDLEFYLAGHVILRQKGVAGPSGQDQKVIQADELYYDANRNVAVALNAQLELYSARLAK